jgi:hypothetical protein
LWNSRDSQDREEYLWFDLESWEGCSQTDFTTQHFTTNNANSAMQYTYFFHQLTIRTKKEKYTIFNIDESQQNTERSMRESFPNLSVSAFPH